MSIAQLFFRSATTLLVTCISILPVGAEGGVQSDNQAKATAIADKTPTYADVAYGADPMQKLDVYVPSGAKSAPVILMVHGGGWKNGDKRGDGVVGSKCNHFLEKGFGFISVNYRLVPKANPLEQARDVSRALTFAQSKAASWGLDPNKFVLIGHSSGAHLVDLMTTNPKLATALGAKPWLGVISLDSSSMDVTATMKAPHGGFFDTAFGDDAKLWKDASPATYLAPTPKPMLLVCQADFAEDSNTFASRDKKVGGRAVVLPIKLNHREINNNLGLPGKYTEAVDEFLKSILNH